MADSTITRITGITGTSINSFLQMFKEDYLPRIDDWIHNDAGPVPKMLMKKAGTMGGKKTLTAAFTSNPQGVGFTAEGYDLPAPTASGSIQPEILGKEIALRHRLTFESQMTARKSSAAFAKPRAEEMRLLRQELALRITRNLHHGPYDIMGVVGAAAGGTTMTMEPRNARRYTTGLFYASGNHYFRVNQALQVVDTIDVDANAAHTLGTSTEIATVASLGGTAAAPTVVLNADPDGTDVTSFNNDAAVAAGDQIIAFASRNDAVTDGTPVTAISEYHGMNGLGNINTDSTLYSALFGLTKTDAAGLLAIADHASGVQRTWTDRLAEFFITRLRVQSGGSASKLVCDPFTMLEVTKEYRNLRQFSPILGKAGSKNQAVVMNDLTLPYVEDWLCLPGLMWGVNPADYKYYEWFPLQSPDSNDSRWVNNKAQEEIILMKGGNVFCTAPWSNGVIDDIAFDTTALI